jgi:hypothetical protein
MKALKAQAMTFSVEIAFVGRDINTVAWIVNPQARDG